MKKLLLTLTVAILAITTILAQAPQAFKYQAIARDASGNTLADQAIGIKVSILQGSQDGPVVFTETHQIQTNSFGLINIGIGKGEVRAGNFSTINWGGNSHYVRVEMDPAGGTNYELMGTAELLSVPYALYAESSGDNNRQGDTDWGINGNHVYTGISSDPSCQSGNVGIGDSNPNAKLSVVMQYGFNTTFRRVNNYWASNSLFLLQRARGTIGSESAVQSGDRVGQIRFEGYHGSGYGEPGAIICQVDGALSGTTVPGNLQFWTTNTSGSNAEHMRINSDGNVGIGTTSPTGKLHIWENSTSAYQIMIDQDSPTGDAAIRLQVETASAISDFTAGIDNDDDNNFEISNTSALTGSGGTDYTDANTMLRINHARNQGVDGIIDFNHQSRARAFLADTIDVWCDNSGWPFYPWRYDWYMRPWFPIPFNKKAPQNRPGFDEHSEFTLSTLPPPGTLPPWAFFTANEEGYYQVNVRVEIIPDSLPMWFGGVEGWSYEGQYVRKGMTRPYPPGYSVTKNENLRQIFPPPFPVLLSIGIFVNDSLYAQGNNYQLNTLLGFPGEWIFNQYQEFMNAPNVSDVVYLDQDDYVEIYVMVTAVDKYLPPVVTYWFPYWVKIVGDDHGVFTFVSVHKVS